MRSRPVKMVLIEFFICCHRVYVPINFFAQTLNCLNYLCRSALQCLSHSNNWDNLANFDTFLVFVAHQNINKCLCPGTGTTLDGREAGAAEAICRINHGNGEKDPILDLCLLLPPFRSLCCSWSRHLLEGIQATAPCVPPLDPVTLCNLGYLDIFFSSKVLFEFSGSLLKYMGVNAFVNNNRQPNRLVEIFYNKEYWYSSAKRGLHSEYIAK